MSNSRQSEASMSSPIYDYLIRVSKMGNRKEADDSTMTVDDQRAECEAAIREKGGRVGKEHKALDQSGATSVDSKPYREALDRIKRGEANGLAVAYDDRLARDWRKLGRYYDELETAGAEVIIVNLPGVDYRTASGRMQTGLMAIVAEQKYQVAKDRGLKIADRTIARGVHNRVPFGYRRNGTYVDGKLVSKVASDKDAKALVPDLDTEPFLVRIFEMRADGQPWALIGRWLESESVAPPRGGSWAVSTLRNIIANETYLGFVILGKRRVEAHAAIVRRSLWQRAQSAQSVHRTGKNAAGVAGGLLRCCCCSRLLSVTGSNPAYTCRRTLDGQRCEKPVYVSKRRADEFVDNAMLTFLSQLQNGINARTVSGDLSALRIAVEQAGTDLEDFVTNASTHDMRLFNLGQAAREDRLAQADAALEAAQEAMEEQEKEWPESGRYQAWIDAGDVEARRIVARRAIQAITVEHPASSRERGPYADVDRRFNVIWHTSKRVHGGVLTG